MKHNSSSDPAQLFVFFSGVNVLSFFSPLCLVSNVLIDSIPNLSSIVYLSLQQGQVFYQFHLLRKLQSSVWTLSCSCCNRDRADRLSLSSWEIPFPPRVVFPIFCIWRLPHFYLFFLSVGNRGTE